MDNLEEKLAYLVDVGDIPAASLGLVVNKELVWSGNFGGESQGEMNYNIGSITKPIVATAVLQLYEDGHIDLDADVSEYLPFILRNPEFPSAHITVRMLLAHRSGMAHYTNRYASYEFDQRLIDWLDQRFGRTIYGEIENIDHTIPFDDFMEGYLVPSGTFYTSAVWRPIRPNSDYSYSTVAYDLLGLVVEQVTGLPFSEYLRQQIFDPIGMKNTGLTVNDQTKIAPPNDRAYTLLTKTNLELPFYSRPRAGGGGLYSTVTDMAQFLTANMNEGEVNGYQMLRPETVALMHKPHTLTNADLGMTASGYGWTIRQERPWQYWGHFYQMNGSQGHGGQDHGYLSSMYMVDEESAGSYGIIVLTDVSRLIREDMTWFFTIYLKLEQVLMEEGETLIQQQATK